MGDAAPRTAYTDGACLGNPGPGGWAWAVPGGRWASGHDPDTTNQRMEITAVLEATRALPGPLRVVSDSTYVVHCWRDRWWEGWLRRGWRNARKEPVANRDLWEPLVEVFRTRGDLTLEWVKGHGGDPMNDLVDRLAVRAAQTGEGGAGDAPPGEDLLAAADRPRRPRAATRDRRVPSGWLLVVTGLRSTTLVGSPTGAAARGRLVRILEAQREVHPDLVVLSGLRPGAEELGALAALDAGVPLVVVLPYPDPAAGWSGPARARFEEACARARDVVVLESTAPADPEGRRAALARRDGWLRTVAAAAIVLSDGADPDAETLLRRFEEALGEEVWTLDVPP